MEYAKRKILVSLIVVTLASCTQQSKCVESSGQISVKQVELEQLEKVELEKEKLKIAGDALFRLLEKEFEESMKECRGEDRDTCAHHFAYEFSEHLPDNLQNTVFSVGSNQPDPLKSKEAVEKIITQVTEPLREEYIEAKTKRFNASKELDALISSSGCN